jgi:DNA-binding NarL/FixJ family response regulator
MKERKDKQPIWLENRPNRNVASLDDYEVGDNGKNARDIEAQIEVDLFIKQLTPKQQVVVRMLYEGYNVDYIAKKQKVGTRAINRLIERVQRNVPF